MTRDHSPRQIEYVTLQLTFLVKTDQAVKVDTDELDVPVWIPMTALHFSAHKAIESANHGDEIELRMAEDTARRKGLL